jgi:Na+-transporting methylmalonyl-CoA/oxaloacetate decarboxylase gamma subunit
VTLRRVLIGGGILLALAVLVFLAVLVGIYIGRGEQEEVAQKEATEEQTTETVENTEQK